MWTRISITVTLLIVLTPLSAIILLNIVPNYERRDPVKSHQFRLPQTDWPRLSRELKEYAAVESLNFGDASNLVPSSGRGTRIYWVIKKNEQSFIVVHNFSEQEKFNVLIYDTGEHGSWQRNWDGLMFLLNEVWPERFPVSSGDTMS